MTVVRYPSDLRYHREHVWVRILADEATFGITWYASDSLGEVVFVDPPRLGDSTTKDQIYSDIESVKSVSDLYAPLSGEILAVNDALADAPTTVNDDPYGRGWLVRIRPSDPSESDALLSAEEYQEYLATIK